jgi:PAS domain S-box-containing protein
MEIENAESFMLNSSIGIHIVSATGIIQYANVYELDALGYEKDEYVGHHVSEFQLDQDVLDDMMKRLGSFESLKNYPARVQGKNSVKYVLYNSSVYQEDEKFVHTRCYGSDIEPCVYEAIKKHSPYFK